MPHVRKSEAPVFNFGATTFVGLASPQRGAKENCVWRVVLGPNQPGVPHTLTREEVFVAIRGSAVARIGNEEVHVQTGDALIVPANTSFALANPSSEEFEAVVTLPVGAQADSGSGPFTPPWAQ